jgi:S-adenosylmethionine:tRNA ribosyltransferase-isomerase
MPIETPAKLPPARERRIRERRPFPTVSWFVASSPKLGPGPRLTPCRGRLRRDDEFEVLNIEGPFIIATPHAGDPVDPASRPSTEPVSLRRSDFDFDLPEDLIAQRPLPQRSASRLLSVGRDGLDDRRIDELPSLLRAGDLLIFNDTRVIKARLHGRKASGGRVEALIERIEGPRRARVQLKASHNPKPGSTIHFGDDEAPVVATMVERADDFFVLDFDRDVDAVLDAHGQLPLPPYIEHQADAIDAERYQTVWARTPGAVAAPTAGLHFDDALLADLAQAGIGTTTLTLHVGAGTFVPVRVDDLADHVMHEERYTIPRSLIDAIDATRARGGRVVAVGTTTLRALESACDEHGVLRQGDGTTRLFITPGYRFKVIDLLLTNFHLPQSTLLILVSAFAGIERIRAAYRHAIDARYRFFSYGDAMLIEPDPSARS